MVQRRPHIAAKIGVRHLSGPREQADSDNHAEQLFADLGNDYPQTTSEEVSVYGVTNLAADCHTQPDGQPIVQTQDFHGDVGGAPGTA